MVKTWTDLKCHKLPQAYGAILEILRRQQSMDCTGKSLSEVLIFASINPQYDNREFHGITSSVHENYKNRTWAEHAQNMFLPCSALVELMC